VSDDDAREAAKAERRQRREEKRIGAFLELAGVEQRHADGGTLLTERVLLVEGWYRAHYAIYDRDGRKVGDAAEFPASGASSASRARLEIHDPDDRCILALLVASRLGVEPDTVLADDGTELARLEKRWGADPRATDENRVMRQIHRFGMTYRVVTAGGAPIGRIIRPPGRRNFRRLVETQSGAPVARVSRARGGSGATGQERVYVADMHPFIDPRLRATALFAGLLWDYYTTAWEPGG
jgi:hypothetical protein